jgi:hypothetical protein
MVPLWRENLSSLDRGFEVIAIWTTQGQCIPYENFRSECLV